MIVEFPVLFLSEGLPLAARFVRNTASFTERQAAVIVTGSWLTVKEQMPINYARELAEAGYTAFVFDFSGFGESRGEPRQTEIPSRKITDVENAVAFVRTFAFVDPERVGCLGVCASAQYMLGALARGVPVKSFASVAGWYHDPASVAPFYGGDSGVALRLERGHAAMEKYLRSGETVMVPAYKDGDDRAGMHFRLDYYGQADRGAVPSWRNEMAEMTWVYWLAFDGLTPARRVATPSLFVHADGCVFPEHVKRIYDELAGPKQLVWSEGGQTDFYDQPKQVAAAVSAAKAWFAKTL